MRRRSALATALGALAVVGVLAFAGRALLAEAAVPAACDNLYKYAHQLSFTEAVDHGRDPTGWSWRFEGGFAELQFYPPGAAALGWMFHTLLRLTDPTAYWLVLVVTWFLPGLGAFAAVRASRAPVPVATLSGVLTGTLVFGHSGTYAGIGCGVLAARLSIGLQFLAIAAMLTAAGALAEGRRTGRGWVVLSALAVAATTVVHLYFVPFFLAVVAWWWYLGRRRGDPLPRAVIFAVASGIAFAGVWWTGTFLLRDQTTPLRASAAGVGLGFLVQPESQSSVDWPLLVAAVLASAFALRRGAGRPGPALLVGSLLPLLAVEAVVIAADQGLGIPLFPANRTFDIVILWMAMVAPLGLTKLGALRDPARLVLAVSAGAALWLAIEAPSILPGSIADRMPAFGARGPDALWEALRPGEGRLLFTQSWIDGSFYAGFTPFATGREAVNGGPVHPSPMQRSIMGGPDATQISAAGYEGNESLLGLRWADAERDPRVLGDLHGRLVELGITQLVVGPIPGEGTRTAAILEGAAGGFRAQARTSRFAIYEVVGATPGRAARWSGDAVVTARPDSVGDVGVVGDVLVDVDAHGAAQVGVRAQRGPYWRVELDGVETTPARNRWGEMVVDVPDGRHVIAVRAQQPPILGPARATSVLAGVALLAAALWSARRRVREP